MINNVLDKKNSTLLYHQTNWAGNWIGIEFEL